MIKKNKYGTFSVTCNKCSARVDTTARRFADVIYYLKQKGWKNYQKANHWENTCPTCVHRASNNTDNTPYWEKD